MSTIGPTSRPNSLAKLDGRTREGRALRDARKALTIHVGGKPSATQKALIDRAAMLSLRIELLDAQCGQTGLMTESQSKHYLAWVSALSKLMRHLGLKASEAPRSAPKTLADLVARQ